MSTARASLSSLYGEGRSPRVALKGCLNRWTLHFPSKQSRTLPLKTPVMVVQSPALPMLAFRAAGPCRAWHEGHVARMSVPLFNPFTRPITEGQTPSTETAGPSTTMAMMLKGSWVTRKRPPGHGNAAWASMIAGTQDSIASTDLTVAVTASGLRGARAGGPHSDFANRRRAGGRRCLRVWRPVGTNSKNTTRAWGAPANRRRHRWRLMTPTAERLLVECTP